MENAVKALIISAGVLIGLMIVSLGIALFSSLSSYTENSQKIIEENALQRFNEQFTRFINCENETSIPEFTLTIQDIVTVANIAYENNKKYGLEEADDNNYYVEVNIVTVFENLEKEIDVNASELLKNNLGINYKCTYENVEINPNTGRVCKVNFKQIPQ